jgi:hypothetical protein
MKTKILFMILMILSLVVSVYANPTITAIGTKTITEGNVLTFNIATSAPDNGSTNFMLDSNAPIGGVSETVIAGNTATLTYTSNTSASFSWLAPLVSANTNYNVNISAGDTNSTDYEVVTITVTNSAEDIAMSDISFGDDDQERSNTLLDDDESGYYVQDTATFTVKNNEANPISNVQIVWPSTAKYNITFQSATKAHSLITNGVAFANIDSGEEITITLSARIPEDLSAFDKSRSDPQDDRDHNIGTLTLTATAHSSVSSNVFMEAENNLIISKLYISVEGSRESLDDGEELEEIKPGSKIEIELTAENRFGSSDEVEIEDIEFTFYVDENDFYEDETEDISDLDPREEKGATISFTLDDDIEEDTYTVEIILEGQDENGAYHGEKWEIDFQIEREDELITIQSLFLNDDNIQLCTGHLNSVQLEVNLENEGKDDSDEIVLFMENKILDFSHRILKINLDEGDDTRKTVTVNLPSNAKPGTYPIAVYTYFDFDAYEDNDLSDYATVDLVLSQCPTTQPEDEDNKSDIYQPEEEEDEEEVVVITPPANEQTGSDGVTAVPVDTTKTQTDDEKSTSIFTASGFYVALLVLGYIVVIGAILILIIRLLKR